MENVNNLIITSSRNKSLSTGNIGLAQNERYGKFSAIQGSHICCSCYIGHKNTVLFI